MEKRIDLLKIEKEIDKLLESETSETLLKWLQEKRLSIPATSKEEIKDQSDEGLLLLAKENVLKNEKHRVIIECMDNWGHGNKISNYASEVAKEYHKLKAVNSKEDK